MLAGSVCAVTETKIRTLRVDDPRWERLKEKAGEDGLTASEAIRILIDEYTK